MRRAYDRGPRRANQAVLRGPSDRSRETRLDEFGDFDSGRIGESRLASRYPRGMTITQLVESIDARLLAINVEISKLTDARRALADEASPSKPAPRRISRSSRRRARAERAKVVMTADTVEQVLRSSQDGITTAAIAEQGKAKPGQVLALLRELEATGKARRSGQRRGTRWHRITDEDRIHARAAELAGRRRKGSQP